MKRAPKSPQQQRRARWETEFRKAKARVRVRSGGRCEYSGAPCNERLDATAPGAGQVDIFGGEVA